MIAVVLIKVEKDVFFSDFNSEKDFYTVALCFKWKEERSSEKMVLIS